MPVIAPTPAPSLTTPPTTTDPSSFDTRADAFVLSLQANTTGMNGLAANVFANATDAAATSAISATQAANAAASASQAAASANAVAWNAPTNYVVGANVFSPSNFLTYRRRVAGVSATDPALDAVNWALLLIGAFPVQVVVAATVACVPNVHYVLTNAAATVATFPASPALGDTVVISVDNLRVDNTINFNGNPHENVTWASDPTMILNNRFLTIAMRWANNKWSI